MSREKYVLSSDNYQLIKNIDPDNMNVAIELIEDECAVVVEDVDKLLYSINVELLMFGLDDEDGSNEYGDSLYKLYDEIYFNENPLTVE